MELYHLCFKKSLLKNQLLMATSFIILFKTKCLIHSRTKTSRCLILIDDNFHFRQN